MNDPPGQRRERKKERTRQALLDAAIRLISERGIHGTRVEDITERADLGKGAFYNYFESKDALVAELVTQGVDLLHAGYLGALDEATQPERLAAVISAHERFFEDHPAYGLLFHQARGLAKGRPSAPDTLALAFADYLKRTGALLVAPTDRDDLTAEDLVDLAAVTVGAIAGYRSFRLAAGLQPSSPLVAEVLALGSPQALEARRRLRVH